MKEKLKLSPEPNGKVRKAEYILLVLLLLGSVIAAFTGLVSLNKDPGELTFAQTLEMERDFDAEDYDEDSTVCDVIWQADGQKMIVSYPYEEYEELADETITAYEYGTAGGVRLFFDHTDPTAAEAKAAYRQVMAEDLMPVFNLANALIILTLSLLIMTLYGGFFTEVPAAALRLDHESTARGGAAKIRIRFARATKAALIMAGAGVVAYILGEGLADAAAQGGDVYMMGDLTEPPDNDEQ